ncbi:ABC transporter permease [Lysinibacillus sp. HST-98]|jgi:peptide/nickel transport system permease protein|uniref:Peptide ABC transporter permease n=1 Tax=Lysinibacillus boronitolerans JCM 21713 = 10a = NBRC 103108 TaxID=1294264 RepID=A0ABR4Y204_9BACI|nr:MULTISPECIES: ABC transporter permease [Lysinibacillus]EKU40662.1 permease protein of oligopeptide ABC transporter [Lysinibacillus fusiformis ZB2]AUS86270.1 ABC transporter permease [Lysinibacillus sp. YS11]KGR87510.1 peptide ABC transporter permease [Lysinibacillus boronitolerans JCM 21713 = 10a = NBRC 103108]KMN41796.1 peptide ABC transporter permease [Lysinibacillus sp. LK3]MBL3729813.1 ABC transporter permease [Lysinibacillus sp. HST-98]
MMYILRRIILLITTILLVSIITFGVFQILPGDPVRTMLGTEADPTQIENLRSELGLDRPLYEQYVDWMKGLLTGQLGNSIRFSMPVKELLFDRLPVTMSLAGLTLIIVLIISLPLGMFAARRQNKLSDVSLSTVTQIGMAVPSFWLGMMLILYIGLQFSFFKISGYIPWTQSVAGALSTLILPALTIAIPQIAVNFRYVRTAILEQVQLDYVRTIRSKGMSEQNVMYKHVLKNSMIPILTVFGLIMAEVVAGTIIVEQVFSLPGIGQLLITAISNRDFPLVQGIVMYITVAVVMINFIVDVLYSVLDPRIRLR